MRARLAILVAAVLVGWTLVLATPLSAPAHARGGVFAQQGDPTGQDEEAEGQETQGEGQGQGSSEAETGAGGESESGSSTETGPPWTYQMARLSIVLLVLLAAAIVLLYLRLIARRQRGEI